MKSPKQLRCEIQVLRSNVEAIRESLFIKILDTKEPTWGIGKDCARTAEALGLILKNQIVPEFYKVAVVGRFKAGKSSFVNELLGARLAGEDTTPETAAVTIFSHQESVKAVIHFVNLELWEDLRKLYKEDPKHIDAHRIKVWMSFDRKSRKNADGEVLEQFDLSLLEKEYIKPGGHTLEIPLEKLGDRKTENIFRRKIKEFTSGTRPHHCFVERIEITSPSPLLDEGVLLIDTPGLDDTERFRVTLTEKAVEDVDAVLFLTQSGAAYGQSEKEFMLTLLRRGTVKQLIFVITQVDKTYDQHLSAADDNDEDAETIGQRIRREELRIRNEIELTLRELDSDDTPAMRRYREQLGDVGLVFTSARNHREWKDGKKVDHGIHPEDPGGIERMKMQLLQLLSTESRLASISYNIATGTKSALDDLLTIISNRRAALSNIKDSEVAEQRLDTFRKEFAIAREEFQIAAKQELESLQKNIIAAKSKNAIRIENIGLLAERELADFELVDVGKHWKTRRSGYWGYMRDLQRRIANKIFPRVQELLTDMTVNFSTYLERFEIHLSILAQASDDLTKKIDLGASLPIDLNRALSGSLKKSLDSANDLIADEEQRIVSLLDDFVSDEVSEKISDARNNVAHIFGRGTTVNQSDEVRKFYRQLKRLLQIALTTHLDERCNAFGSFLIVEAKSVPDNAIAEVQASIRSAEHDIKAAATLHVGGERESFVRGADLLASEISHVNSLCAPFINTEADAEDKKAFPTENHATDADTPDIAEHLWINQNPGEDWIDEIQESAIGAVKRFTLKDGDKGWPYNRIFTSAFLAGSTRIALIDPYLAQPHQIRNLKEFIISLAETAKPKQIIIITSDAWVEGGSTSTGILEEVGKDLFQDFGTDLSVHVDRTIHDRYVVCDNGILFKLGRGLDIYKPAVGLASHRPAHRRVRKTDIDIFAVEQWIDRAHTII